MAMFHCSVQICAKRGGGKSSVAAAAYRACESIEDDRTGITHDFTHKGGHVYGEVMLCENAPKEYRDRALLWNAVEKVEKNSNARTAREVEVALPMLTTRPFKESGEWGTKEKKGYKLDDNGNKIPIIDPVTGEQKIGARNRKMWERELVDSTGWNKQELVEEWRASWADKVNKVLAEIGVEDRVDHRSYERQGKDIEPTIHEGISRKMEEKYNNNDTTVFISDRMEENKKIREINLEISSVNTTSFTFNSSIINGVKSEIKSLFLASINASLIGCLTLILTSSLIFLPSEIKCLTKSILASIFSSTKSKLDTGYSSK